MALNFLGGSLRRAKLPMPRLRRTRHPLTLSATVAALRRRFKSGVSAGDDSKPMTIAYPGVPGAFSEMALNDYFAGVHGFSQRPAEAIGMGSYTDIFSSVAAGEVEAGVVPVEDSISGTFHNVYDALLEQPGVHIIGEHAADTDCCLCVVPGASRETIKGVSSNPEILKQCSSFLDSIAIEKGGSFSWLPAMNSAQCASSLADSGDIETAVICSHRAADLYGLTALETNISDCNVSTRYLIVAADRTKLSIGERLKSSIVFALPNEPLAIFKAISAFALRGLNISKIESRKSGV